MTSLLNLAIIFTLILISGCAKKTETEQLAEFRDKLTYTQYRLLTASGLPLGLKGYQTGLTLSGNKELPTFTEKDICTARVVLAYGSLISDKRTISLAEADLVDQADCAIFEKAAASSLRSVLFHRQEWPTLSKAETERANLMLSSDAKGPETETELTAFHVALGVAAMMGKDYDRALVHVDALGLLFKQPWLGTLGKATIMLKQGEVTTALRDIKRLSEDESVPLYVRTELGKGITHIENQTGNIDAPAFAARVLVMGLWEVIKTHGSHGLSTMAGYADTHS
ncbi:MAG TPA: hypothetical protein VN030_07465 [Cellvibrio sp.]|nr:hypothetical protein [Cellvibrio sp.]